MASPSPRAEAAEQRREILQLLERLHRNKDAAYGDAWRKRGEVIAIFANMARKYDRLLIAFEEDRPASTEALGDTVGDLCVYTAKYLTWIAEQHAAPFAAAEIGIDPVRVSPAQGPEPLATVFAGLADEPDSEPPASAREAWREVRRSFEALDRALVAQSTPGAPTTDPLDFQAKTVLAWQLCIQLSWLMVLLERETPGTLDAVRDEVDEMDTGRPGTGSRPELVARVLERVTSHGSRAIALLGFTPAALAVKRSLTAAGLADRILGIFDDRQEARPHARPLADLAALDHDLVVVAADAEKADTLLAYRSAVGERAQRPEVVIAGTGHLAFRDPDYERLNAPALVPSYATGSAHTREHLYQCLKASARAGLRGAIVEFGAFKGGTTAWLARVADDLGLEGCRVIGLDSWAGFPPRRSVLDLYEHPRCVFTDLDAVRAYVEPFGGELIAGDISDTYTALTGEPILLAFFDTDNYSPARAALELCVRQLVVGGSIVFDHVATTANYVDTLGERIAAYEVLDPAPFLHLHGTGVFTKLV
jgi:O-methyltransferase